MALAIVKRWPLKGGLNKSQFMDCLPKQKKSRLWSGGHCGEVAVSEGLTVLLLFRESRVWEYSVP